MVFSNQGSKAVVGGSLRSSCKWLFARRIYRRGQRSVERLGKRCVLRISRMFLSEYVTMVRG